MNSSHISMPAEKVRELAIKCLEEVAARRKLNVERLCDEIRKPSFLASVFRVSEYRTNDEIVEDIKSGNTSSGLSWRLFFAETDRDDAERVAKRMLLLAKYGDPVMVSGEDLELLT